MNLKHFKYVEALAKEGSFSRAAETLNITQPSLSQNIKKIETQVGMLLFDRTNGNVRLTDAGRVYLSVGRKMLDLEHQMEVQISDLSSLKTGTLIIGASPYRAAGMLPLIARQFRKRYPGIHLIIREATTAELAEGMARGEYDLCLTMLPVDERLFRYEKVMEEELVLACPAFFPPLSARQEPGKRYPAVDASQVDGKPFIVLTETQFIQRQLDRLCDDEHLALDRVAVVKSLEAQIAMVRAGVGMAVLPTGIERLCTPEEVRFYSFHQNLPRREVVVMWHREKTLSRAALELKKAILSIPL